MIRRANGQILSQKRGIQADATCVFHGKVGTPEAYSQRICIEIDRETRPTQTWAEKIAPTIPTCAAPS